MDLIIVGDVSYLGSIEVCLDFSKEECGGGITKIFIFYQGLTFGQQSQL